MHFLRIFAVLLAVNFMTVTVATADTTAKLRGPKEFDAPQQTRIGPLTPADTLWRLAEQSRPDRRINMYQMMYALYQKNPDAFLEENFNHLKPGAFLQVPSIREILAVDALEAQRKSENDDRIWAERVRRVELAKAEAAAAKQLDIVSAKEQLSEELSRVEAQQTEQISDLRDRIGASMANVETIVQENTELKQQLNTVVQELGAVKSQLDKDSEIQTQLQQLLAQQTELLEQQREQIRKAEEGFNVAATLQKIAASPLGWAIAGSLPAFALLYFIVSMIRRRGQKAAAVVTAATAAPAADPNYRSPLPPLDDSLDFDESSLINLDDSLLNDNLGAGIRLDNDAFTPPAKASPHSNFADDLLDDDFMLSPDNKANADFDLDSLLDEAPATDKSTAKTEFDPNNILSGDDLSSLFNTLEEDEPAFTAKAEFDPNNILSNNELSSLFDNLADEDPDDIFNQAQAAEDAKADRAAGPDEAKNAMQPAVAEHDELSLDEQVVTAAALQNAAAQADEFDELLEEIELDIPGDDDQNLLDTADDEFDIDALLASTQQREPVQTAAPETVSATDADDFDIDSLLAANPPAEISADMADEPTPEAIPQFDSSELDAFAESLAEEVLPEPEPLDEPLLAPEDEDNITELLEPDPTELYNELDDILSEVAELRAQSQQQTSALAELALPATALDEAAADFADAELSVADVSAMLQDDLSDEFETTSKERHDEKADFTPSDTDLVADAEDIIDIAELMEDEQQKATDPEPSSPLDDAFMPEAEFLSASRLNDELLLEPADENSIPVQQKPTLNAHDLLLEAESDFALELDKVADTSLMPDLQLGDDLSVSRVSEGHNSVERPSKVLDSYPELDFADELLVDVADDSLIYPDDLSADGLEPAADLAHVLAAESDLPDELAALEDIQFDQLLSELDDLDISSASTTETAVKDDFIQAASALDFTDEPLASSVVDAVDHSAQHDLSNTEPSLDFLQIDKLLASTEDESSVEQPLQIDVGLADFPNLISPDEVGDVDQTDAGFAGRLDLIRAYNEIGDADSAEQVVKEILASDAPEYVKEEALILLSSAQD